ncbi:MAG: hypothetical protein PHX83_00035 [Acidobacteriia bacterium]|nr:hypothetical protein [Terriglobia bacterium]
MKSHGSRLLVWKAVGVVLIATLTAPAFAKGPKVDSQDLITKHLQSIGAPQALVAETNCIAEGTGELRILTGGSGYLKGPLDLVSAGDQTLYVLKFSMPYYSAEEFGFNGKSAEIGYIQPGQRSTLGTFLFAHKELISEGLLGGVLSTAWPLRHLDQRHASLHVRDLKKVGNRELYEVRYQTKRNSDLTISLYFDPQTFRHVMSVYTLEISAGIVSGIPDASAFLRERQYRIEEDFDNFQQFGDLTLPTHWRLQFSTDAQVTQITQWDMNFNKLSFNQNLSPDVFTMK